MDSSNAKPITPELIRRLEISLDKDYVKSSNGLVRLAQIITLVTSVSSLVHYIIIISSPTHLILYVFMTANVMVCLVTLVLYCMCFFSLNNYNNLPSRTSKILIIFFSAFSGHLLLVLSFLLGVEAAHAKNDTTTEKCIRCSKINIATVFGFLSWILFTVELIQNLVSCRKTQVSHSDAVQET